MLQKLFFSPYKEATIVVSSGTILQWEKNSLIVFQRPKQPRALEINSPVASKEVGKHQISAFSFQVSGFHCLPLTQTWQSTGCSPTCSSCGHASTGGWDVRRNWAQQQPHVRWEQNAGPRAAPHVGGHRPPTGQLLCLLQGALSTQLQKSCPHRFTGMQWAARRALPAQVTIPYLLGLVSSTVIPRVNPSFRQQCKSFYYWPMLPEDKTPRRW